MLHSVADNVDLTQTFDGDGQTLKRAEVDTIYEDGGSSHTETNTLYQLRSSALGGKVLTEVGAQGQKGRTYVYADGALLAWQSVIYVNGAVTAQVAVWEHRDPSNASYRTSQQTYADTETWAELDPFGSNAGLENPYQTNPPPQNHKPNIFYPSFSLGSDGTCRVDQVQESCSTAMQLVNAHAASVKNGRPGFYGDYLIIDHQGWDGKTLYQNSRFVGITIRSDPQDTVSSRVDDALDLMNRHPKCEEALNEVLSRLAAKTGVKRFDNMRAVLQQFRKDGSITETPDGSSSVTDNFKDQTGIRLSVSPNREVTAEILLHELLHYAGGPNLAKSIGGNQFASNYEDPEIYEAWKDMGVIKSFEEWMQEPAVSEWYKQHPE
jgi:hypothetical protein